LKRHLLTIGCVLGVAGAGACGEITPPSRTPRYLTDVGAGVFHWPFDRLPVRYYVDPRGTMAASIGAGLRAWELQFFYGEFRATFVTDSASADVIVLWADSVPPDVPPDTAGALGACSGVTTFLIDSTDTIMAPVRVQLSVNSGYTAAQVAACMRRVAAHELGHTLGIFTHSPAAGDLMYAPPSVERPTARDRAAVEVLYHSTPTIGPPP
jgi:hypothetical protein